jgi:nitroreductase
MTSIKAASTDYPIQEVLSKRWSPYCFGDRAVSPEDLRSIFEAARWAASSYNEQPWRYIVATKDNPQEFERVLSCLVEGNQLWAKNAPVVALGCACLKFALNAKPNAAAIHDLGLAAGNICAEATARGVFVHQMIGILPDKVRQTFAIPDDVQPLTALAIGYPADPKTMPEKLRERDLAARQRKRLAEFVFGGGWGQASRLVE